MGYGLDGGSSVAESKVKMVYSILNNTTDYFNGLVKNGDDYFYLLSTILIEGYTQSLWKVKNYEDKSKVYQARWRNTQIKIYNCMLDVFKTDKMSRMERVKLFIETYDERRKKSYLKSRSKDLKARPEVYQFYNSFLYEIDDEVLPRWIIR